MEEKAGHYKQYNSYFKLSEGNIRKIYSVFEKYSNELTEDSEIIISVMRKDNSYFETNDLNKILEDENTIDKSIEELSLEIVTLDTEKSQKENSKALLNFSYSDKNKNIYFMTTDMSRNWCFLFSDEMDSQIKRIIDTSKTSKLINKYLDTTIGLVILIISLFYMLKKDYFNIKSTDILDQGIEEKINFLVQRSVDSTDLSLLLPFMFSLILIFLLAEFKIFSKIINITNKSVFYWGDMISIYDKYLEKKNNIKWVVIVGFIISVLATITTSISWSI